MCGIAGFYSNTFNNDSFSSTIVEMLSRISYRGPDESGYFFDEIAAIGSVRLNIIDLNTGSQPMSDRSGRYWIAYNGEVYNYKELKARLKESGHAFSTESDTEVVLHSYIEWGARAFEKFNGGFGVAIYDTLKKELILARDRYGKRPLFYVTSGETTLFASEMKAFAGFADLSFSWDSEQLASIFTHWTPLDNQTGFKNVMQLPAASYMLINQDEIVVKQYAELRLDVQPFTGSEEEAAELTREKLKESVRLRLQSDVEVGVYLSGGLDSSITSLLAKELNTQEVRSFSVSFADQNFDESKYQNEASAFIGTKHHHLQVTNEDIARDFPQAVYHAEVPLIRTAPVPLFTLSKLVSEHGVKVVLTGEGSDEGFLGYDIFKETNLLERWIAGIDDQERERLVAGLHPYLKHFSAENIRTLAGTYSAFTQHGKAKYGGHSISFRNSRMALKLLNGSPDPDQFMSDFLSSKSSEYDNLSAVEKTQWLEFKTLLGGYLLSSQGDRMSLAHAVENRCPFLDPNVLNFAFSLPLNYRLKNSSTEKYILKQAFKNQLPESILTRNKQPYLAPDAVVFLGKDAPDYVESVLSPGELKKIDVLDADFSETFVSKLRSGAASKITPRDNQAFLLLLSLSLLDRYYVKRQHPELTSSRKLTNIKVSVDGRRSSNYALRPN